MEVGLPMAGVDNRFLGYALVTFGILCWGYAAFTFWRPSIDLSSTSLGIPRTIPRPQLKLLFVTLMLPAFVVFWLLGELVNQHIMTGFLVATIVVLPIAFVWSLASDLVSTRKYH